MKLNSLQFPDLIIEITNFKDFFLKGFNGKQ